jgi:hypothetical protein
VVGLLIAAILIDALFANEQVRRFALVESPQVFGRIVFVAGAAMVQMKHVRNVFA